MWGSGQLLKLDTLKPNFFILSLLTASRPGREVLHWTSGIMGLISSLPLLCQSPQGKKSMGQGNSPRKAHIPLFLDHICLGIQDPQIPCADSLRAASRAYVSLFPGSVTQRMGCTKGRCFQGVWMKFEPEDWDVHTGPYKIPPQVEQSQIRKAKGSCGRLGTSSYVPPYSGVKL